MDSRSRHRRKVIALGVLAASLLVVGISPAAISTTEYKASRAALTVDFETRGFHINLIRFEIKVHCDDGTNARTGGGIPGPISIDPKSGRFTAELSGESGEASSLTRIKGSVRQKRITGHIFATFQGPSGGTSGPVDCRSGSAAKPWVYFVARRVVP